ncbi:MAG: sensor histidine kinase [Dehalococcoidia bacterium]
MFYYPALLGFSLMFPGRPSFAGAAIVIGLYILMAFTVSPELNVDLLQEKVLVVRIVTMIGIVVGGTLINGWERSQRLEAVAAERRTAEENLELQKRTQQAELAAVEERSRIAREIHDGIAQSMYMLSLHLETCADLAQGGRKGLTERLAGLVALSKKTLLEVRHYIFDLKPYLEGEKGMASMVENQVREFNKVSGIHASLNSSGEERQVPASVATCLYRVTQESLANVFKHAHASQVRVLLEILPDGVQLTVRDDGQGFHAASAASGHGLPNMRQRVEELGGEFNLQSSPAEGTKVVVRLPC